MSAPTLPQAQAFKQTNSYNNKYYYYIKITLMIALFSWFSVITFIIQFINDINDSGYLLIIPSLGVFVILLLLCFHYDKIINNLLKRQKVVLLSGPALLFGLYLLYSAIALMYLASSPEDYFYGYGYLFSYFVAYVNALLVFFIIQCFHGVVSVNYDENIVCLIGYYAAIFILLLIAYNGMGSFSTNERFALMLKASGIGLISLPVIYYPISFKWTPLRGIFFLFAIFMLLKADSRSAILGAFVGVMVIYLIKHTKYTLITFIIATIIVVIAQFNIYGYLDKLLLLSDKYRGIDGSFSNRIDIWKFCLDVILNHPFIGVGFRMSDKILSMQSMGSTHNVYLMILMESGIIGTILLLLSMAMCFINLGGKALKHKEKTSLFYIGLLSGTLVFGMGERFLINIGNLSSLLLIFALFHAGND